MANVAVMGFGTVGSGVYEILKQNAEHIAGKAGEEVKVKYILDIRDFDDHPEKQLFTKNFADIAGDASVSTVVEVMGGLHPAYEYTKELLENGKSVITSNKELVATHGTELLEIAEKHNTNYFFEASVGGGIPIIRPMHQCLAANEIEKIAGILNGTTNYILTQMIEKGKSFGDALTDAQNKGYAERNPAADVEGHDACRKIAILASLASGKFVDYKDIPTEGITEITLEDVRYADSMDCVVKLIGYAEISGGKVMARVCPMIIPRTVPLSDVDDVFNAIMIHGNMVGDVMMYGRGAGMLPTASAVVADVIDAVKHSNVPKHLTWTAAEENIMLDGDEKQTVMFIRTLAGADAVRREFADAEFVDNIVDEETAFLTPKLSEKEIRSRLDKIGDIVSGLRVLEI
jgi:homoserine dehydrogenase